MRIPVRLNDHLMPAAMVLGGFGAVGGMSYANGLRDRSAEQAKMDAKSAEWQAWSSKAEAEFPGQRLRSDEQHERFVQFLKDNPAPSWVSVSERGLDHFKVYPREDSQDDRDGRMRALRGMGVLAATTGSMGLVATAAYKVGAAHGSPVLKGAGVAVGGAAAITGIFALFGGGFITNWTLPHNYELVEQIKQDQNAKFPVQY